MQNRSQLLLGAGCAALAIGLMFSAERAEAQAFNASETFVQGTGTRVLNATGSETILIDTPTAVIDWTPDEDGAGNALDFLPTGADATFENSDPGTDFAVLNRILPAANNNVVVIDGTVVSQFRDALGGATPGGTVAFYSPTGLFIGDNAVFDVGNLILSTLDIDIASFDAFTQSGGTLSLAVDPVLGPQTVTINPGASVTASAENSYFVVTSAQIQMFGTTDVNGSQAFVAGDEVLLTLDNGLFTINVPLGTSSANPIVVDGNVGGPSSTGLGDNHLIYAVAAAQNDPISLLFSGNLGFAPAASAGIVNGEIIISANYDVFGRTVSGGTVDGGIFQDFIDNNFQNPTQADVFLEDFTSSSTILAAATNEVQATALNGPSLVDGDLIMLGRGFSELTASNGQTFDITGSALVSANDFGEVSPDVFDPAVIDATGGVAFIDAFGGGILNIAGDARVTAQAGAGYDLLNNVGGTDQGGSAQLGSTGGTLNVIGDAIVSAGASGFQLADEINFAGDSTGGTAAVFARDGGQVMIGGLADVSASAVGRDANLAGVNGSEAFGGNAFLESTNGGTVNITGLAQLDANAFAGSSNSTSPGTMADGGNARAVINGTGSITLGSGFFANGVAFGGQNTGGIGGDAVGGSVGISVNGAGTFMNGGDVFAEATGSGGVGLTQGGDGTGGTADIAAVGGALIDLAGETRIGANGFGGDGGTGFVGGTGTGGLAIVDAASGGIVALNGAAILAGGLGGSGFETDGGAGVGGNAIIRSDGVGSEITIQTDLGFGLDDPIGQSALLGANGRGGDTTGASGVGGGGIGGIASVIATNSGSVILPASPVASFNRILARGNGGSSSVEGGAGGLATGGTGIFEADSGGEITAGPTLLSLFAVGGSSSDVFSQGPTLNIDGGDAIGGERRITIRDGATITAEFSGGTAGAAGGDGSGTGIGGSGSGGVGNYVIENATFNSIGTSIFGGGGGSGGRGEIGGNGSGGDANFTANNATINLLPGTQSNTPTIAIFNQKFGGVGVSQGGDAFGGTVDVEINNSTITGGNLSITSLSRGGDADTISGTGGNAVSGDLSVNVFDSALEIQTAEDTQSFTFDPNTGMSIPGDIIPGVPNEIGSIAQGGSGATGGNATSGFVDVEFGGGSLMLNPSSTQEGILRISADATGGSGTIQSGDATGGFVGADFTDIAVSGGALSVSADGDSAAIESGADGGSAFGGFAGLGLLENTSVELDELSVSASGITSLGGTTDGGSATLFVELAPGEQVNVDTLNISGDGIGGTPGGENNRSGQFSLIVIDSELTTRELNASAVGDALGVGELGPSQLTSSGGSIGASEQFTVDAINDVFFTSLNGGTIGDTNFAAPSTLVTITAQNTLHFIGDNDNVIGVGGSVLTLSSSDIVIGDGARIGAPDVILNSLNMEDPAILGGAGVPGGFIVGEGYTLVGEELDRIEVVRFTFNQQALPVDPSNTTLNPGTQAAQLVGPNDPSLIIRDYVGSGSAGDGTSNVTINVNGAGGILRIEGVAGLEDATDADSISLSAQERIEIVTPGGVGIVDVDGNPIGALFLQSDNIWAADAATIEQLQNDPNFAGRNDLLANAVAGSDDPLGYIRGGEVNIFFSESLLVRNTGTNLEQGGILVGDGGLFISNELGTGGDIFAYGARFDASTGSLITGEAFFNEVEFFDGGSGSSSFTDESAFNDCLINTGECLVRQSEPEGPSEEEEFVRQEAVQASNASTVAAAAQTAVELIASEEESNEDFGMDFPSFVETEENEDEGDIDDPVASGGDASFYGRGSTGDVEVGGSSDE